MSTYREILSKLFTRNVIVKRLPGGRLKAYDVNKSQQMGTTQSTLAGNGRWRTGRSTTGVTGYGSGFTNEEIEAQRRTMYMDYEMMDTNDIISSVLDIYAEESTTLSIDGELLVIKTENDEIRKLLHNLFYDILNIEFNMWSWIRTMCKYGDAFLYLQLDEEFGVVNVVPIHPSLMIREEGTVEDPSRTRFRYEGEYNFRSKNYFEAYEIAHFRLMGDQMFLPYGRSIIDSSRKTFKALLMMEDAMILHRIMRSPERRLFKIDVGNLPPSAIDAHVEQIIQETKKTPYIDPNTGDYNVKFSLMSQMEDIYLPVRGGDSGTTIETLPGLENTGQLDDVEYLKNKLLAGLKVPKEYLGYGGADGEGSAKSGLASLDLRFARTIERLQKIFVSELYKIAIIHLKTHGIKDEQLIDFEIFLTNPSLVFERQKTDVLVAKVDLVASIKENNLFSNKYIYENIFGLTEDVWKAELDRIIEDKKFALRLKQIEDEGNDPQETGKVLGTPFDIASMQVASKFRATDGQDLKKLYTPDERVNNARPDQHTSSFETARDKDFGSDPAGRKEMAKSESVKRILKMLNKRNPTAHILSEDQLFDDEVINEA